jgi:hypothetical protein
VVGRLTSRLGQVVACLLTAVWPALAAQPPALRPLAFLLGDWQGVGTGKPGESGGDASFASAIQDTVIVRTSFADYPATAQRPAFRHDDLMVIYVEGGHIRADYWDNEGHVLRYAVQTNGDREAVFLSDPLPEAPRFRLTYTLQDGGTVKGRFDIAPPGKPGELSPYLVWTMRKRTR